MKIYYYLKHFPPFGAQLNEGTSKAVHGIASGLTACGVEVIILCEGPNDSSFKADAGYAIECFANIKKYQTFTIASRLKKYIQTYVHNSLVVINGIFHPSVYSMFRLLKKYGVPYVVAPHDPYHPYIFSKNAHLKWPYWYFLEKPMLRQANAIQVLDIRHTECLRRLGVRTPVIATPNGFSPDEVHPESTLQWLTNRPPKLLFLGRIDAYNKGLDMLIDAFTQITETSSNLTIQGPDWGDKKKLEQRADSLLPSEAVSFLEPDYTMSASSIIAEYDIFCLPSRFDGFGLSALEAMLAGRVLLVSEVAGIAPHIKASGCGVVVKPETSAIKAGLTELIQRRSEWKRMGLNGRHYILEHLQWNKIASAALEQYKYLIP